MAEPIGIFVTEDSLKNDNGNGNFEPVRKYETREPRTDWRVVRLLSLIIFLSLIQTSILNMSGWPYMKQIDPAATSTFFGYVSSVSSLAHAIFALLIGFWSSVTGQTKLPLIISRLIAMIGCFFYLSLELFSSDGRYVMLLCYAIFGISMSSISVAHGYIVKISTVKEQAIAMILPIAVAHVQLLHSISTVPDYYYRRTDRTTVGNHYMLQLLFTPLSYPGYNIIGNKLLFNIYTGPIYVTICANTISLIIIIFFFDDKSSIHYQQTLKNDKLPSRKSSVAKKALTTDMRMIDLSLVLSCILVRLIGTLTMAIIHTITPPLMMFVYGWSNIKTVKIIAYSRTITGLISIMIFVGFISKKLTKIISERFGVLIALTLFGLFFLLTYPWRFFNKISLINEGENITVCDSNMYEWCSTAHTASPLVYIGSMITVVGIAHTAIIITVDTIYSRILGTINRGTMQGLFVFVHDTVNICGPIIIAPIFASSGQRYIWMFAGIIIILISIRWIIIYERLPKSKAFVDKLRYQHDRISKLILTKNKLPQSI